MIPSAFKVELLGKVDIVDVIDAYVPLKKAGASYVACCPFHHEKTPSFHVSREKQFYHCFGCGVHGDAISFMMDYVGLDFPESIEKLASLVGLTVPRVKSDFNFEERKENKKKEEILKDYNQQLSNYFFLQKNKSSLSLEYLKRRGLSKEIIETYQIGYAPNYNYLAEVFPNSSIYQDLVTGGLLSQKEQNYYPRFRDRIMFPIKDIEGAVIGFGGRIMDTGEPKYLNSPETILFDKSQCLYGLYEAKNQIRSLEKAIVVEGYMDVISLAQYGVNYAVATLGTATTGQHIRLLFRFSNQIYFCFDGDEAGRKAAWRALNNALEYLRDDKILYFVFLPEGEDPDSYVREYGKDVFESFINEEAIPLSQYFIEHLIAGRNLQYGEVKADIIKIAKPLLSQLKASSLRFMIMKDLANQLQISMDELSQLIGDEKQTEQLKSYRQGLFPAKSIKKIEVTPYNKKMLNWLLINPKLASYVELPDYLEYSEEVQCLLALSDAIKMNNDIKNAVQLEEIFKNTKFSTLITDILQESLQKDDQDIQLMNIEENFKHGIAKIKKEIVEREIYELKGLMKQRSLSGDEEQLLMHLLAR
ncbi:DNA primase [Neisseriaceae bacterium PsAf]|nr:DNA primase [Neisseriaceae bacterium PsAf]MCV2502738.1 DNA primase [Neisseriaceae bacterium]